MITFGVVTPSFNQAGFLSQAVASVMDQEGPFAVNHLVMDGGSDDGSLAILKRAEEQYAGSADRRFGWHSGPDSGQYAAVEEGFRRVGGDVLCWLNADDVYMPWAFSVAAEIFSRYPEVEWLTSVYPMTFDQSGASVGVDVRWGYGAESFRRGMNLPGMDHYARYFIQQDCTFWRRSLWEKAGARFDPSLDMAADFELWARFFEHAQLHVVASPLAAYRVHPAQKTARSGAYEAEAAQVLRERGWRVCGPVETRIRRRVVPVLAAMGLSPMLAFFGLAEQVSAFKHGGRDSNWQRTLRYIF
ncbi:glycosyltransferase [Pseudodesulfovibrio tunisiensis]|uniref:glycosyltransferase n=1 Tax=Pseudodesulfovibrio tunisiensis TaxID=463192 RepID=UPI001FB54FF5|nr:glycosyltransferase [Pseudodesulfovibrio tunisiensis]